MEIEEKNIITTSLLLASVAVVTAGVLFYNVMPLYLGQLQESNGLSLAQIGLIASLFFGGFNLASFSSYFWVRRAPLFQTTLALTILLILGLLLAIYPYGFFYQAAVTFTIGFISGGIASIAFTIAGDAKDSTRWYGLQTATNSASGVILLFVLPVTLIPTYGFSGLVYGMIITLLLLLPAYFYLLRTPLPSSNVVTADERNDVTSSENLSRTPALIALAAVALLLVGASAVWAFIERIAAINEFDPDAVGRLLGISLVFAVIGSLMAAAIGNRFGNILPYLMNCLLMIVGIMIIAATELLFSYTVGACIFLFGWAAATAYAYSIVADVDPDGKHVALSVLAVGIGSMIGPASAGYLLDYGSLELLQWMVIATVVASVFLAWMSTHSVTR
jgi:predicted MFS family arabinose efflux permease